MKEKTIKHSKTESPRNWVYIFWALKGCVPPQTCKLNLILNGMVLSGAFGGRLGPEGGVLMIVISALYKRDPRELSHHFPCEDKWKSHCL